MSSTQGNSGGRNTFYGNIVIASRSIISSNYRSRGGPITFYSDDNEPIVLNENTNMRLDLGFTNRSLIGAMNELKNGGAKPGLDRTILLSQNNGNASTLQEAIDMAIALNPGIMQRVVINATPGTYYVDATIEWPAYVDMFTDSSFTQLIPTAPNFDVIHIQGACRISRIRITGAFGAAAFNIDYSASDEVVLDGCDAYGCDVGFRMSGPDVICQAIRSVAAGCRVGFQVLNNAVFSGMMVFAYSCTQIGFEANGGNFGLNQAQARDCPTGFLFENSFENLLVVSQAFGCGVAYHLNTTSYVDAANIQAIGCTTDLDTAIDIISCTIIGARLDENKLAIANDALVNLNIRDINARDKFFGGAAVFDIQQVDLFGTSEAGGMQPTLGRVTDDDGFVPQGQGLILDASTNQQVQISNDASMVFNGSYTVEFWFESDTTFSVFSSYLVYKNGTIQIIYYPSYGFVYFTHIGLSTVNLPSNTIINNSRVHLACVMDNVGKEMAIYVNGNMLASRTFSGSPGSNANDIFLCSRGLPGNSFNGSIDEINFWSKALSPAEITARYNGGDGLANADTVDLMAGYHCGEGSGTVLTDYSLNSNNGTHDASYGDGLLADERATNGVIAWMFDPDISNELFFNIHPNATYQEGKPIIPILHWAPDSTVVGDVVWSFELSIAEPGSPFPSTNTITVVSSANGTKHEHILAEFPSMTLQSFYAIILGRLFRDTGSVSDTYPGKALLLGLDLKFTKNKLGSDT